MFLLLAISILFILTLIHFLIHGNGKAKIINEIPGPKILPIVGNGLDFLTSPDEIFIHARDLATLYPQINRIWMLNVPVVNIYNPYDCEILMSSVKHIEKSFIYDFLHPWLNKGLLTSTGEKWHQRRKILTPTFHFSILKQFSVIFEERSRNLVDKLNPKGEIIDITALVRSFTLHTICETAMGTDLDAIPDEKKLRYENAIQDMSRFFVYRMLRAWFYVPFIFSLSPVGKMQKKTISMLHNFTNEVIKERRTTWSPSDNENLEEGCEDVLGKKKRLAMLDLLFSAEAEGKIDEDGIREEVDTFMFEGHDTLTSVLSCCLMEFANNHYIQNLILEEILDVFGNLTEKITVEKLNQLNYLERCVKEGLRLYPGVPLIGRIVHEDVQLKNYLVPAETTCLVHIFDLHRDPNLYANPKEFDPDRFLADNCAKRHPYAYLPFSAGPRNCIGQRFALLEQKFVIVSILRRFRLDPITRPQDVVFTGDFVLKTKHPIKIKLTPRKL